MMRSRVVLIDLPKDGRRVIEHSGLPAEPGMPYTYRGCKGKFCSRKNANRRVEIVPRSKSSCA